MDKPNELGQTYKKDDIDRIFDGDTTTTTDGKRQRYTGYDSFETDKDDKITGNPLGDVGRDALEAIFDDGGTAVGTGRFDNDKYKRELTDLHAADGTKLDTELIEAGLAQPINIGSSFEERQSQAQAEMTSVARQALGLRTTQREDLAPFADQAADIRAKREWRPFTDNPNAEMKLETYDKRGTLHTSWDRGIANATTAAGGFLNWMGDAFGKPEWVEKGKSMALKGIFDGDASAREVATYEDISSVDDAITYLIETTGEMAPQVLMDATSLLAGAGIGGSSAIAFRRAAVDGVVKAAKAGALSATAANGFIQGTGNMEVNLEAEGSEVNTGAAAASGVASAVLNTAPIAAVLPRFGKAAGLSDGVVNQTLKALDRVKDIGKTAAVGAATEGAAGTAQAIIDAVIEAEALDEEWDIDTTQVIDDTLRGILGGGGATAVGSGMSHAFGAMREYDQARKSVDAEGNAQNKDGWMVNEDGSIQTEETVEEVDVVADDPDVTPDIDRRLDWGIDKGEMAEGKENEYWSGTEDMVSRSEDPDEQGYDEKMTHTNADVPNLKSDEYKRVESVLRPNGKPLTLNQVSQAIDAGEVTQEAVVRYLSDDVSGQANSIYGRYDAELAATLNARALNRLVDRVRDGEAKFSQEAIATVNDAVNSGDDDKIKQAVKKASPALASIVNKAAVRYDWKRMWNEYTDRQERKPEVKEQPKPTPNQVEAAATDAEVRAKKGIDPKKSQGVQPLGLLDKKPEPTAPDAKKPKKEKPLSKEERYRRDVKALADIDEDVKAAVKLVGMNNVSVPTRRAAKEYIDQRLVEYRDEINAIRGGDKVPEQAVAMAETDEDGNDRTVGDVHTVEHGLDHFTELGEERSERERKANREGFTRQVSDLFSQLSKIEGMDAPALQSTFKRVMHDYVGKDWQSLTKDIKDAEDGNGNPLGNASHPYKIVPEGEGINRDKYGQRPIRALKKQSVEKLNKLMSEGRQSEVIEHLTELGVFAPGHVVGEMPKTTRATRLKQYSRDAAYSKRKVDVVEASNGKKFVMDRLVRDQLAFMNGERAAKKGTEQLTDIAETSERNATSLSDTTDEYSAIVQLTDAVTSSLSELLDNGYDIDVRNLSNNTVVYRDPNAKNKKFQRVTLGELRNKYRNRAAFMSEMEASKQPDYGELDGYGSYVSDMLFEDDANKSALDQEKSKMWSSIDQAEKNSGMYANFDGKDNVPTPEPESDDPTDVPDLPAKAPEFVGPTRSKTQAKKDIRTAKRLVRTVRRKRGAARQVLAKVVRSIDTRIRNIHPEIADSVRKFTLDTQGHSTQFVSKMEDIGNNRRIQKGWDDAVNGRKTKEAAAYMKWLNDVDDEIASIDPNHKRNTAPRLSLDMEKVDKHRAGFADILKKAGVADPHAYIERLFDGNGIVEFATTIDPVSDAKATSAVLAKVAKELKEGGFLDTDAPRALTHYANAAARHMAWQRNMAKDGKLSKLVDEVHPSNKDELIKLMDGVTGKNAIGTPRFLRIANSVTLGFHTATILWFSAVASIPELAGVVARNKGQLDGLHNEFRKSLIGLSRDEIRKFAKDYGVIGGEVTQHALQQLFAMDEMTVGRTAQRIQNRVFAMNGQHWLTQTNRMLAASAARNFLSTHAESGTERSKRLLAELDIDADTVKKHLKDGNMKSEAGRAYTRALHRFVNQAVTNPRADQLPLIATDPRYAMVTSLKKFFYGFYGNVNKGLTAEYRAGRLEGDVSPAVMAMVMTAAAVIPLAIMAEVLREFIKYPLGRPDRGQEKSASEYMMQVVGATGMLGPLHMAQLPVEMSSYGKSAWAVAAGPTASYLHDMVTGKGTVSRHIPIAAQQPYLRKLVDDTADKVLE